MPGESKAEFDTEMVGMDLRGPSPTPNSTSLGEGDSAADSFFDVFTEIEGDSPVLGSYNASKAKFAVAGSLNRAMVDSPFLKKIFGNERMNVYVEGQEPFSIVTQNRKVQTTRWDPGEFSPSVRVYTDMDTINQLVTGELAPTDALLQDKV